MAKQLKKKLVSKNPKSIKEELVQGVPDFIDVNAARFLTREEQLGLEEATNSTEKARLALSLAEQVQVNKSLEKQLADRAVIDARNNVVSKDSELKNRSKVAGERINYLREKYGITGNFQYDPTSGRIIKE